MFKYIVIDQEKNKLLCNSLLVGIGEIAEIYEKSDATPPQATGKILIKIEDPDVFAVCESDAFAPRYEAGERCIFKILCKNLSGSKRRKFFKEEKAIVNIEHGIDYHEQKVCKAKTGSVRKRRRK